MLLVVRILIESIHAGHENRSSRDEQLDDGIADTFVSALRHPSEPQRFLKRVLGILVGEGVANLEPRMAPPSLSV